MRNKPKVLVVDDESASREILARFLSKEGYTVATACDGADALAQIADQENPPQVVITDLSMPKMGGMELIQRGKELYADIDFLVVTADDTLSSGIQAMKAGAFDYLLKPYEFEQVLVRLGKLSEHRALERKTLRLKKHNDSQQGSAHIIAESPAMKKLLSDLERIAKTDATVLISGETGVGKEVLSRYIHDKSPRSKGPFVAVNCSAIPDNLIESEFFGHEKGSFTGADNQSPGFFEVADEGTLFLDELGEMDIKLQPKILRALESRLIRRVGGRSDIPVDVRLVAATNRDLKAMVANGSFREDLYYRLNVVQVRIPPLRERREDIPSLTRSVAQRLARKINQPLEGIDDAYIECLMKYSFPGNVRELNNIVERSLLYMQGPRLEPSALSEDVRRGVADIQLPATGTLEEMHNHFEAAALKSALSGCGGDVAQAARMLGISKAGAYAKMTKHGIKAE